MGHQQTLKKTIVMKKLFLSAAFVAFGLVSLNAQVKFGAKAGVQLTNLVGNDDFEGDSKFGFHVGGYANIRFAEQFAFQPELLLSLQGSKYENEETVMGVTAKEEAKWNLIYLQIPLMLKWYAYEGFNVEFGPQVGFNVSAKEKYEASISGGGISESEEYNEDIEDIETMDFSLNIGAGYEMENGLNFGIRYGLGLTEILKDSDLKNSVIGLSVGYTF